MMDITEFEESLSDIMTAFPDETSLRCVLYQAIEQMNILRELATLEDIDLVPVPNQAHTYIALPERLDNGVTLQELREVGREASLAHRTGFFMFRIANYVKQNRGIVSPTLITMMEHYLHKEHDNKRFIMEGARAIRLHDI